MNVLVPTAVAFIIAKVVTHNCWLIQPMSESNTNMPHFNILINIQYLVISRISFSAFWLLLYELITKTHFVGRNIDFWATFCKNKLINIYYCSRVPLNKLLFTQNSRCCFFVLQSSAARMQCNPTIISTVEKQQWSSTQIENRTKIKSWSQRTNSTPDFFPFFSSAFLYTWGECQHAERWHRLRTPLPEHIYMNKSWRNSSLAKKAVATFSQLQTKLISYTWVRSGHTYARLHVCFGLWASACITTTEYQ